MKSSDLSTLRQWLTRLKDEQGLTALKTGTEVEDMSFSDIAFLREISQDIVPLYVKLGGPEARNDIRELSQIGVDGMIAPMIESVYALKKFIQSLQAILKPEVYHRIEKGINLETVQGFSSMSAILSAREASELSQITAARTDLSGSLELEPDNDRVMEVCAIIVAQARENELRTSVGGAIHPEIVGQLVSLIHPDTINTRHMVISCKAMESASPSRLVQANLEFEAELNLKLADRNLDRSEDYLKRAKIIQKRLEKLPRTINNYT